MLKYKADEIRETVCYKDSRDASVWFFREHCYCTTLSDNMVSLDFYA